jgi:hypothetical protein
MIEFQYSIIRKSDAEQCGLHPQFWINHPEWEVFVRTNVRAPWKSTVWLGGGGKTFADALEMAKQSVTLNQPKELHFVLDGVSTLQPPAVVCSESPVLIINAQAPIG